MKREILITIADFRRLKRMIRQARHSGRLKAYLNELERELRRAAIVPVDAVPPDTVTMNSRVRIWDADADLRDTITVVYPHHADWEEGHIPVCAPLGTALLGMRVGDVVRQRGLSGPQAWEVEKVLYQPESAGDHHL